MKQFLTIMKFELMGYFKNKVFVWLTVSLVAIVGLLIFSPQIIAMFKSDSQSDAPTDKDIILVSDNTSTSMSTTLSFFSSAMPQNSFQATDKTVDELKPLIDSGEYAGAIIITGPTSYNYIVKSTSLYDTTQITLNEIMLAKYRMDQMTELGLNPEEANSILNANITGEIIQTGKDQSTTFFYTYILIFALYMAILLYGQMVATSVASEKSSRAMEVLITSAKPTNLMFGKVIGSGLAGLFQMVAIFGSSFIFYNLNRSKWDGNPIITSIFDMPIDILLYAVLFFALGYFIYSFLYGAVGSLASKVEDINTSSMPIVFIFIIAFMVVIFSMNTGDMNSTLMIVASHFPLTSPMAMFARIAMSEVPVFEIIISTIILLLSTIGIGYISAKIYKVGVLMYGKPPKLTSVFKAMKNQ